MDATSGVGRPRVAVVGGGISGLAAAWALRDRADVVVLEQSPVVGGKLRVGALGDLEVDLGAESFLARRPEAVGLVAEVGLDGDLVHPATTAANVLRGGRMHPLPARTVLGVPSDPDTLPGLLTAGEVARVRAEADLPPLTADPDVDVATWVGSRLGAAVVDRIVEPLLGGVYAGHSRLLSAQATLPALWAQAARSTTLLDAAAVLVGAGAPGGAPAPGPVFAGLRGGVGRLPLRLAERLVAGGATVRTGVTVRLVERRPGGWRLTLGPASTPAHGPAPERLDVDAVVLAVPAAPAARLLGAVAPEAAAELAAIETASVAVVACLVPRATTAGLPGSGLLVPPAEGRPVKAMTFSSAKWAWTDGLDPEHVVVRLSLGRHREEAVLQRDDEDLVGLALTDASGALGRDLRPVATTVLRWGGSLPQPAVGHRDRVRRIRAAVAQHGGLAVCGAAFDGVGIPSCIAAARAAADQVVAGQAGARQTGGFFEQVTQGATADR